MSTKAKAMAVAQRYGATVVDQSGVQEHYYCFDAPRGYIWKSDGIHILVASQYRGPWGTASMWKDIIDRMEYGIEPCLDKDCEFCNDPSGWE